MSALELVPSDEQDLLDDYETQLFRLRQEVEVIWLEIGRICSDIVDLKLYRLRKDENGNYFRTGQAYFEWLGKELNERGLNLSKTTLNRFVSDHRLYHEELGVSDEDMVLLGRTALDEMAPAVRKLKKEQGPEAALALVNDILGAARATGGLPVVEVRTAVDEYTGRITKGLSAEFKNGTFGRKLSHLTLYWGEKPIDLLKQEVTPEQEEWVCRRLGVKPR